MEAHQPTLYTKNIELYRRLERKHKRWRTIRRLFDLSIEDVAFVIGLDESHTHSSLERQARKYYATLLDYEKLERTNDLLRADRMRQGLSLGETAFLLAGEDPAKPSTNKLRAARQRTGLSQGDAAHLIRTSRSMLSRYERGTREPDVVTAMTLSTLYDLPINKMFPRPGTLNRRLKKRERMLAAWRRTCQRPPDGNPGRASIIQ
jgi:transcriptional regulator with XRE-family HTH domain